MNNKIKLFIQPIQEELKIETVLCEKTNTKKMYVHGVGLRANHINRNKRMYPENVLDNAIQKHIEENGGYNRLLGELDHPKNNIHELNIDRLSHKFVDIKKDGPEYYLKAEVLEDTICGKQLKGLLNGNVGIGFSSRGSGSLTKDSNGVDVVDGNYRIISLADCVIQPSLVDSIITPIYEKYEFIYENGRLVQKDLSEDIDNYQKMIKNSTKSNKNYLFEYIVKDYFSKILG